jgi:integrase
MRLDIGKRRNRYRLVGQYAGTRLRLSLGTPNYEQANKLKSRIATALVEGTNHAEWPELAKLLPPASFQSLAALVGYEEKPKQIEPTWEMLVGLYNANTEQRIARNEMRASSKKRNDISLREFSMFLSEQGITKLRDIKSPVIERWKAWRIDRINRTKQSRNGAGLIGDIEAVHRVFQFGMRLESDWVVKNPVRTVRRMRGEPNPYTEEELQAMFEHAAENRFTLLVLLHTGLRAGDAVKLRWEQVNFEGGFIDLQTQKCSTQAWIPLSPELLFAVQSEWQRRKALPGETVLLNQWHRPMSSGKYLQDRVVKVVGGRAGVGKPKVHRFRHTFISKKVGGGASYADVGRMVGDSAATIEKYYAKFSGAWKNRLKKYADSDFIPPVAGTIRAHSPTQEGVTH